MTDARDDEDRAIARALDVPTDGGAVDERALDDYRRVVAHLPIDEVAPPADLEDRTIAAALARRPAAARSLPAAQARASRRRTFAWVAALGTVAAAAAIVAAVLVTTRDSTSEREARGRIVAAASTGTSADELRRSPGARVGSFGAGGRVVLASDGRGALFDLATTSTIVIELVTVDQQTPIGSAAPDDGAIAFSVDHADLVVAVRLSFPSGAEIATARLSPG